MSPLLFLQHYGRYLNPGTVSDMLNQLYYFNKLRKYLGWGDAFSAFKGLRINKSGVVKVSFIRHPFQIRVGNTGDSATFNEVVLRQEYDIDIALTPKTIIDGGANIGLTAIYFASKYPEAEIISIEPEPENFNLLQENTAPYPQIKAIQSGIWSHSAHLKIIDSGKGSNAFTVEETNELGSLPANSIAGLMQQQGWDTIDILKLDIEGSEKHVFSENYDQWLPKTRVLVVETHDRFVKGSSKAVFNAIGQYNFSCRIKGFNLVFYNNDL